MGVLALQGAVTEHIAALEAAGVRGRAVKRKEELEDLSGLILPGGESTAIGKLMERYGFVPALRVFAARRPVFGTCAGMVLLAQNGPLGLMDIKVRRNAFGRQRESFEADLQVKDWPAPYPAVFIRAPYIESAGRSVEVLAQVDGHPVLARQKNLLVSSFHPELTGDARLTAYFIGMTEQVSC
ncbi:MAG: pyridoxal 5'-phosphate synthase glutaminase subunit PdxT [Clostridiales bacterium]|nr:pyridoxal 5'-phosphate synthase glutaminase subunit PdxT [Clostridiales bacterium]